MFQKILLWLRERINKMLGNQTIKDALKIDTIMSQPMMTALQSWVALYENRAPWLMGEIKSLNIPAAISGEIARAVTIEMVVSITGEVAAIAPDAAAPPEPAPSKRADYLAQQFKPVQAKLRQQMEFACAKGGIMLKPWVRDGSVIVDFVAADQFFPIAFDANGDITACVFSDQRQIGDKFYTRLEYHSMNKDGCMITNSAYRSTTKENLGNECPLAEVEAWAGLQPVATITKINKPLFAYFKFPAANNIDSSSPLGVSCFSRAIELIEQCDRLWDNLLWEMESGKRAIDVDELAFDKDDQDRPILPNRRLYRTYKQSGAQIGSGKSDLFQEWSPTYREANILNALESVLKRIEFNCSLAYGTLSDPNSVSATATEIISQKQRSYALVMDCQNALATTLDQLLYAMDVWVTLAKLAPKGTYATSYDFDDSIVVDSQQMFMQDSQAVSMQIMPKYIFAMRNFGLTETQAKKWIEDFTAEMPEPAPDEFAGA